MPLFSMVLYFPIDIKSKKEKLCSYFILWDEISCGQFWSIKKKLVSNLKRWGTKVLFPFRIYLYKKYICTDDLGCVCVCVGGCVAHSYLTLCNPVDCSPPGSWCSWNFLARNTGVGCHSYSKESFWPRDQTHVSCISCIDWWILYQWVTWESQRYI